MLEAGDSATRYRTGELILKQCNFSIHTKLLNIGGLHSYALCPHLLWCSWLSGRNGRGMGGGWVGRYMGLWNQAAVGLSCAHATFEWLSWASSWPHPSHGMFHLSEDGESCTRLLFRIPRCKYLNPAEVTFIEVGIILIDIWAGVLYVHMHPSSPFSL